RRCRGGPDGNAASSASSVGDGSALVVAVRHLETDQRDPLISVDKPGVVRFIEEEFSRLKRRTGDRTAGHVGQNIRAATGRIEGVDGQNLRSLQRCAPQSRSQYGRALGLIQTIVQQAGG